MCSPLLCPSTQNVGDLPLSWGAGKATHIEVHLTTALEGEQEFTHRRERDGRGGAGEL